MSTTLFDLTGRTALITGSSRGLGRAMAEGMAEAGAAIVIVLHEEFPGEIVKAERMRMYGGMVKKTLTPRDFFSAADGVAPVQGSADDPGRSIPNNGEKTCGSREKLPS